MKDKLLRIRIRTYSDSLNGPDRRENFWLQLSRQIKTETNNPDYLEYSFKKNFPEKLKDNLKGNFHSELKEIENNYRIDFNPPYFDEFFFRNFEKQERIHFDDVLIGFSKIQELKNEFFKDNPEYQELMTKSILASQVNFGVSSISYSSLDFDLNVEPIEKVIKLFDNNFELFYIFLNSYIPESFKNSISLYDDDFPINVDIEVPESFKNQFNQKNQEQTEIKKPTAINDSTPHEPSNKWEKAKWAWSLANGSLLLPVLLSLLILYLTFNKLEKINEIRQLNYDKVQIENDKLIKNYQQLIEYQKIIIQGQNKTIK